MRIVVASRYDSGSSFLKSYHMILVEMYYNSVPKRIIRVCLNRSKRYFLGRVADRKREWLTILAVHIMTLKLYDMAYDVFLHNLRCIFIRHGLNINLFELSDDVETVCRFRNHPKNVFHEPGDPIIIIDYRGKQSERLHQVLRKKYSKCTTVYRHDRYFSSIQLFHKGLEHRLIGERLKPLQQPVQGRRRRLRPFIST